MGVLRRMVIGALVGAVFGCGYYYLLTGPFTEKVLCPSGGLECLGAVFLTAGGGMVLVLVLAGLTLRLLGLRPAWPTGCMSAVIIMFAGLVVAANSGVGTRFEFVAIGVFTFAYSLAAVLTTGWGADGLWQPVFPNHLGWRQLDEVPRQSRHVVGAPTGNVGSAAS